MSLDLQLLRAMRCSLSLEPADAFAFLIEQGL
jgi:hypothetical protein